MKSRNARKDFKVAHDNDWPAIHQEKIREKRKEFTRLITTANISDEVKKAAQRKLNKTEHVFIRKSNAGRPPIELESK